MLRLAYLLRFFRAARPLNPMIGVAFGVALVVAGFVLVVDSGKTDPALASLVLLQALAVSAGFMGPARRGHYDLPLTTACSRLQIAFVHWAMSAWPGIAAWLMIAALEAAVSRGSAPVSLSSGTVAAMLLISTVPWAVTVPWSRGTGGISWVFLLVVAAVALPATQRDGLLAATSGAYGVVASTAAILVWPWMLVGRNLATIDAIAVVAALGVAAAAMTGALAWIERADVPLETAQ